MHALAVLPLLLAVAAAPPARKSNVPVLIQQLGADTYAERDGATKSLEKIGAPALRELRRAMWSADLEVRRRAKRIVDGIESKIFGEVRVFAADAGSVNGVAFSPDGLRAASADSRGVRLWDVATGKLLAHNDDHRDRVMVVAFSPDGKRIATGSEDKTVRLWEAGRLTEVHVLKKHTNAVRALAFSADGARLVSGGMDARVQEWEVASGKPLRGVSLTYPCYTLALQGDALPILSVREGGATLVNLETGKSEWLFKGQLNLSSAISLARVNGHLVTCCSDATLNLWDLKSRKCLRVLKGHTTNANGVAVSPDGKWAVSGGHDKVLRLWDLEEGRHVREFRGHAQPIWCVAFSPDGKHALSGSHDGTMRLWAVGH